MKHAEHHCCCLNMGSLQFSPELDLWRQWHSLWKLVIRCHTGHQIKAHYIRRLAQYCQITGPLGCTLPQAYATLWTADTQYSLLKPKHILLQTEFLASHLSNPMLSDKHHKVITRLVSLEALWDTYHRIKALKNATAGCSVAAVEFSMPSGTAITTSWAEVEATLSSSLKTCAHGSPFLKPPLAPLVGIFSTGQASQEILNGTFCCPPDMDGPTRQFIEALKLSSDEAQQYQESLVLQPEDFIAHWKKAKERTLLSPLGLHFSHYKSATHSLLIVHLHARFMQLIFMMGLSISRFQASLQVILEKRPGISMLIISRLYY